MRYILHLRGVLWIAILSAGLCAAQSGSAALEAFQRWKSLPANASLGWEDALRGYEAKLRKDGADALAAERTMRLIVAYDEAELYDRVYAETPRFNTQPNQFLAEAIEGLKPGAALDAGMGQGRNAIHMARKGWTVTGFDVSRVGLRKAAEQAAAAGVTIETVRAADEEFDFGRERWDLIAIIHALEKRSVHRVRQALKPGGVVVVEAAHREPGGYAFGYESGELLKIFAGFRFLRYEERLAVHDFEEDRNKRSWIVRLVAQKPFH
jgi:SAM-dependent methyltransferase